jgi:transcriptional regulator with XRE-family HTH domain
MATASGGKRFGATIRRLRLAKDYTLRQFAQQVGVSPTYLSLVEQGQVKPPVEERVRKMAELLDEDPDPLLALAGRVADDLSKIVRKNPKETADLLRRVKDLSPEDIEKLIRHAERLKGPR